MVLHRLLIVLLFVLGGMLCPHTTMAGPGVVGGEHSSEDGVPVDIATMTATVRFEPTKDIPAFQTDVLPVIDYLKSTVPEFAAELVKAFSEKRWYLVSIPLATCPGGYNMVDMQLVARACQSLSVVKIDRDWFLSDSLDSSGKVLVSARDKQKITIVHELLRSVALKNSSIEEENIQFLVRVLFGYEGVRPSPGQLAASLEQYHFGKFRTVEAVRSAQQAELALKNRENGLMSDVRRAFDACLSYDQSSGLQDRCMEQVNEKILSYWAKFPQSQALPKANLSVIKRQRP